MNDLTTQESLSLNGPMTDTYPGLTVLSTGRGILNNDVRSRSRDFPAVGSGAHGRSATAVQPRKRMEPPGDLCVATSYQGGSIGAKK